MRSFVLFIRNILLPLLKVVTFIPRMVLRGIGCFFRVIVGFGVVTSAVLMATVFPYCAIAIFVAKDTAPYWNGLGYCLFSVLWTAVLVLATQKTSSLSASIRVRMARVFNGFADAHSAPPFQDHK